jgi:hypothetical protein
MRILAALAGALALVPSLVRAYTNPVIYEDLVSLLLVSFACRHS